MSKGTSRTLFLLGLLIWIIGIVVFGMSMQGAADLTNPSNIGGNIGGLRPSNPTMFTAGYAVMAVGGLLILISWIGALIRTAVLGRWGWFVVLLVLGLIGLLLIVQLIYVFFGPNERRVARRVAPT